MPVVWAKLQKITTNLILNISYFHKRCQIYNNNFSELSCFKLQSSHTVSTLKHRQSEEEHIIEIAPC